MGAGIFGSYHASKFSSRTDVDFAGVFDTDLKRALSLAEKHGAKAYEDHRVFLQDMDAVVIAAPASDHFQLARAALENDCHCLVEKPLALTVGAVDELIELADKKDLILQVGHQERYVCDAVGLLSRKRAPLRIECIRRVPYSGRCNDVSVAYDLMVHDLDIIRQLTKGELSSVHAIGDKEELSAELVLDTGALAVLSAGRRSKTSERSMTLVYDDGVIDFDFIRRTISNTTGAALSAGLAEESAPLALRDPLAHGAALFVEAIQQSKQPMVSGLDGRITVAWAEEIEAAAGIVAEDQNVTRLRA